MEAGVEWECGVRGPTLPRTLPPSSFGATPNAGAAGNWPLRFRAPRQMKRTVVRVPCRGPGDLFSPVRQIVGPAGVRDVAGRERAGVRSAEGSCRIHAGRSNQPRGLACRAPGLAVHCPVFCTKRGSRMKAVCPWCETPVPHRSRRPARRWCSDRCRTRRTACRTRR